MRLRAASSTARVSHPKDDAFAAGVRAWGGAADTEGSVTSSVGPAKWRATCAIAMSTSDRSRPRCNRSIVAAAATMPVSGSAIASAQKHGPRSSYTTRPPATAASSPNATRWAASPVRPWPVIETQTSGPLSWRMTSSTITPSCSSARGRDASTTTSAASRRRRSASRPSMVRRSTTTLCLPLFNRSKNSGAPARAASGRSSDSTLITRAPLRWRRCEHKGPAHSEERSTTSGGRSSRVLGPYGVTTTGRPESTVGSIVDSAATGRPSRTPLASRYPSVRFAATVATVDHTSVVAPSSSSQAGTASTSSSRDSATASQPSAARTRRVVPPQLTAP